MKPTVSPTVTRPIALLVNLNPTHMKTTHRILISTLVAALALPLAVQAAKGDRKKGDTADAFAKADKDGDGVVTEAEFIAAASGKGDEAAAKKRFARMDKDHDGKLTKEEFSAAAGKKKKKDA